MNYWDKKIVREQLDQRLKILKGFVGLELRQGWVKTIREVLGLSASQLGKKSVLTSRAFPGWKTRKRQGTLNYRPCKRSPKALT